MKSFSTHLTEENVISEEIQDLQELALPFGIDAALAEVARRSGLRAVSNVLSDVFEGSIRMVGRNPLKTTFFILALDILVNEGKGRDALVRYLTTSFPQHAGYVLDAIFAVMDTGIDPKNATKLVSAAIEAGA